MSDTQNEKEDTRQWFLRIGGETVFGPVSTQGLIVWAEQGRILPGHEVSTDRKKWLQAVAVDTLGMRWFVDDGEGELRGPLNRLAAEALIKSGKVPEGAQLVSADDVEPAPVAEREAKRTERPAHDPARDEALRVRIRELETMVTTQRERLAKLADADALEAVQRERDALSALVKEAESQRETLLRNAEKDARAHERKQELLRQQIKKLEQQLEESNNRILMSDEAEAARPEQIDKSDSQQQVEQARNEAAEQIRREMTAQVDALTREATGLRNKLAEVKASGEADRASLAGEREMLVKRVSELEQALAFHERRTAETAQIVATREAELDAARKDAEACVRQVREEVAEQIDALQREVSGLKDKLDLAGQALAEARASGETDRVSLAGENEMLVKRVSELEQTLEDHERRSAKTLQVVTSREAELAAVRERAEACERRADRAEAAARLAEEKALESEATFAELLADANARDNDYLEKIAALEKACAQPPEETARFFADQAAVYELAKAEVDELSKAMEAEREHVEQLKEWSAQRQQALVERRQTLLKQLGSSPAEMTRRAVREQPSDPNAARVRMELDNLRIAHQRELRQTEDRERDMQRKLRVFESEATKLLGLAAEGEKAGRRVQELADTLRKREQELADERKNRDAEREQFQGSQQALMMRIETLEKAAKPTTPDEIQLAESKNVKLASWMRLRK